MIAHHEPYGMDLAAVEAVLVEEPLAAAAAQTIAGFTATSELLTQIGALAVDYGVGKPLPIFQSLLATYRALVTTQAALSTAAQNILATAEDLAART